MASREKKTITAGRKQTPTPASNDPAQDPQPSESSKKQSSPSKKPIAKRIRRPDTKIIVKKKAFKRPLKAKNKINRNLLNKNKRTVQVKKALIKNGVAKARVVKRKIVKVKEEPVDWDEKPPVLEPIYPLDNAKKKVVGGKKKPATFCSISDAIESNIKKGLTTAKTVKTKERVKKTGTVSSIESIAASIEDVINHMKVEIEDVEDEGEQIPKLEAENEEEDDKSKIPKLEQENNTLSVIDMLDLNIRDVKMKPSVSKRRHSIEKFEITANDDKSVFNNLPRSLSPKNPKKPVNKLRQSLDSKKSSPYTTRSDSPARMLRNGKQRKLKHMNLLDGLNTEYKKRRRLCSDYSGSEVSVSKGSGGYESDSSFSDMASLTENVEVSIKKEVPDLPDVVKEEPSSETGEKVLKKEPAPLVESEPTSKELALKINRQLAALAKNAEELTKTNDVLSRELALRKELAALAKSNEAMARELALLNQNASLSITESSEELALKKELLETLENNPPDSIDINSIPEKFAATIKRSLSLEKEKTFDTNSNLCSEDLNKESETQQTGKVVILDIIKNINLNKENPAESSDISGATAPIKNPSDNEENKINSIGVEETAKGKKLLRTSSLDETGRNKRKLRGGEEGTIKRQSSLTDEEKQDLEVEDFRKKSNLEEEKKRKSSLSEEGTAKRKSSLSEEAKTLQEEIIVGKLSVSTEEKVKRKSSLIAEERIMKKSNPVEEERVTKKSNAGEDEKATRKSSITSEDGKMKTRLSLSEEGTGKLQTDEENKPQTMTTSDTELLVKKEQCENEGRNTRSKENVDIAETEKRKMNEEVEPKKSNEGIEKRRGRSLDNEEAEKRKAKSVENDDIGKAKARVKEVPVATEETEKKRSRSKEVSESDEIEREKRKTRSREILENEEFERRKTRSSMKKDQNEETKEEVEEKPVVKTESEDDSRDKENFEVEKVEPMDMDEDLEVKNEILKALGLQSLRAAEEAKLKKVLPKNESYTGTLKTVIKLNRHEKKKGRNSLKMTLQKKGKSSSAGGSGSQDDVDGVEEDEYKIMKEGNSSWKSHHGNNSSDTAGAQRKSHYSNRSNMDGSSEHTSDGDTNAAEEGKSLVIPEKASSFSIHPGRLCKDECSYCFGKFGLFDTPCHIAQIKSIDRQNKILSTEKHLTRDSCLCDACYRHVDRKSNTPSYTSNKSLKRNSLVAPGPRQNHCHVLGCGRVSSNILKRKWLIKMRKSVCQVINIDLDNPGLHSIPICEEHYAALEHLMVCAMCKRRLARNHIHYLGQESNDLNAALNEMGIPVKLNDKPVVCKLCRYFATLVLKNPEDRNESSTNFFIEYRKRLLHFHDIEVMDEALAEEPIPAPIKEKPEKEQQHQQKKKKKKAVNNLEPPVLEPQVDVGENKEPPDDRVPSMESRETSPSEYLMDYSNLIPPENNVEIPRKTPQSITVKRVINISSNSVVNINSKADDECRKYNEEARKFNEESTRRFNEESRKLKLKSDIAVQRLGSNPSISVRQLFPGEEDLQLSGNIEFHNVKERTPEGWEKCVSTIQFDPEVKMLWNELQKPYGNQSSFLRHLILLEKYFRNGDLVLSSSATNHSVNYTESVQNRLRAYDNIPTLAANVKQTYDNIPMLAANIKQTYDNIPALATNVKQTYDNIPTVVATIKPTSENIPPTTNIPVTLIPLNSGKTKESKPVPAAIPIVETVNAPEPPVVSVTVPTTVSPTVNKILPVTISQVQVTNTSFLVPNPAALMATPVPTIIPPPPPPPPPSIRPTSKHPPGLISIQGKKMPLMKLPQSQKIKFPITKHWRPNLIPVDPAKKSEKKPGLVQVISGGKPYHISVEDYKKMCAFKRTFDMRQKRLQDQQKNSLLKNSRKNLIITKTTFDDADIENSLEKLDKTVEKLEASLGEKSLPMPKIPKSLTVIPQTVTKKLPDPVPSTSLLKSKLPAGKS